MSEQEGQGMPDGQKCSAFAEANRGADAFGR